MSDVTATLRRAAELSGSGKHREAVRLLSTLLSDHPGNAAVLCQLAGEQLHVGAPAQALALARRAMVVLPGHHSPHLLAALAHTDLGEHDAAVAAARAAVAEAPRVWQCHSGLAEALSARGGDAALRDAEESATRAVELAPEEGRPYEVLGDAALLRHDWGRAEWAYRTALRLRPKSSVAERGLRVVRKERDARARAERKSARGGRFAGGWRRGDGSGERGVGGSGTGDEARDEERIERDTRRQELGRGVEAVLWPVFRKMWLVQAGGALLLLMTSMPDSTRVHGVAGLL
ncbi:tetratricopeptide repeat protein, partial [Actinoalloteichus spitiensis]|uniref:tetratricopeptide repeat protein n=1 Tax=Actinoalloteichus spitiensis TaxID=252394 RepID=UPI00035DFFFD